MWEFVVSNSDTYVHENDASYVKGNTLLGFVWVWVTHGDKCESQVVIQRVVRLICIYIVDKDPTSIFRLKSVCHNSEMSMYVGAVILRRCQGVMPYDVKFHNDISEMIWQEVDLTWLSYYSSICMDDLRKPQITSFVADVRFDCPMVFWIEGKFCIYVTDIDVSTGPFFFWTEKLSKFASTLSGAHQHSVG